jgi:hypothetical protein
VREALSAGQVPRQTWSLMILEYWARTNLRPASALETRHYVA